MISSATRRLQRLPLVYLTTISYYQRYIRGDVYDDQEEQQLSLGKQRSMLKVQANFFHYIYELDLLA